MPSEDIPPLIAQAKEALDAERKKYDTKIKDSIESFRKKTLSEM